MVIVLKRIFFVVFLLLSFLLMAQRDVDSFLKLLNKEKDEKEKVKLLIALSDLELNNDSRKALQYAAEALNIALKIKDVKSEILALHQKGLVFYYLYNLDSSNAFYTQSLAISEKNADTIGIISALNGLGNNYSGLPISQSH